VKAAVITPQLATKLFGGAAGAMGQTVKLESLAFTVIGVFKEKVETFGQSEVSDETVLIPASVALYFRASDAVDQLFFSVRDADQVQTATQAVAKVIQSRHRSDAVYHVTNLAELLQVASKTTSALTLVLGLISIVTLIIGGVGIMNIMLANIRARVREIGIRKAIGARRKDIVLQFLSESLLMSMFGGAFGTTAAILLLIIATLVTGYSIPLSTWSIALALSSAGSTGILFGTVPAKRAADLDPVRALHAE
jgi:putative ABC transport system permease protein